jgi:bacillopeptidase F
VDWITATGPGWGKAEVYIDGVDKGTVDLYASSAHWQTAKSYSGLSSGSHTMQIKALGAKNASATSTKVSVDGFAVH